MVGFMSGLVMPKAASEGPVATIATVLLAEPPMMKPPIITLSPVSTSPRVEMLPRRVGLEVALKLALTEAAAFMVTVQPAVPKHPPPDHPANVKPEAAAAESVTLVPSAKLAEQVAPQSIPAGDEVTDPEPDTETLKVNALAPAFTTCVTVEDVAALYVASPEYCARIACEPVESEWVLHAADPLLNGIESQIALAPSRKVTLPVAAPAEPLTAAVSVTVSPAVDGFGDEPSVTPAAAFVAAVSTTVTVAAAFPSVAPPVALDSITLNVLSPAAMPSSSTGTVMVLGEMSPSFHDSIPCVAV